MPALQGQGEAGSTEPIYLHVCEETEIKEGSYRETDARGCTGWVLSAPSLLDRVGLGHLPPSTPSRLLQGPNLDCWWVSLPLSRQ
jgi:hypothetical protein